MPHSATRLPFSVQVFLMAQRGGDLCVLLLHRRERPELGLPAFWQGVSGALEEGESCEDAAMREVMEETGIELKQVWGTGFEHCYPIRAEWRTAYGPGPTTVAERVFYTFVSADASLKLSAEHQASRWCSIEEADVLLSFGENRACLGAVAACVLGRKA